jgi:ATP/maltotriose-dependent transcriptional regulator MalT
LVSRARLTAALDAAESTPLTLLVAPAGAGKTALVSGWAVVGRPEEDRAAAIRWVASHEHSKVFGQIILAAGVPLATVRRLADREGTDVAETHAEAIVVLRKAAADRSPDVVVVDDAHLLPAQTLRFLYRVLETAPASVRLVLLTRRDLLLPVVPLQLASAVTVLRAAQLRFTDAEAKELVAAHAPTASTGDIRDLQEHTQGWAAALILGARTLDRARDRDSSKLLLRTTEAPVLDYLLGELFESLPEQSRSVLLATCLEPDLSANAAAVLSGMTDAPAWLAELARDGLLVTAYRDTEVDGGLQWRYHPLLLELLRRRTGPAGPDRQALLDAHLRAAHHYDEEGDALRAIRHATLCADPEVLAIVLLQHGPTLLASMQSEVVHEGFSRLSEGIREEHPELLGLEAMLRWVTGDLPGAVRLTGNASEALERLREAKGDRSAPAIVLAADVALLGVWQARLGWTDPHAAIVAAERVLGCQHANADDSHHSAPGLPLVRNAWLMLETAAAEAWHGDLAAGALHVQEALLTAESIEHTRLIAAGLAHRSMLEMLDGSVQTAADTARLCIERAAEAGVSHDAYTSRAHLALCWAAYQRLDIAAAGSELAIVQAAPVWAIDPFIVVLETVLRALLLAEQGRVDDAIRGLAGRLVVPQPVPAPMLRLVALARAHLAQLTGDVVEVQAQAVQLSELGFPTDARVVGAVAAWRRGEDARALADLDSLAENAIPAVTIRAVMAVLRLTILLRTGEVERARRYLPDVLSVIAPQQLLQILTAGLAAGPAFTELLYEEIQRPNGHPFASEALAAMSRYRRPYPDVGTWSEQQFEVVEHADGLDGQPATNGSGASGASAALDTTSSPTEDGRNGAVKLTPREIEVLRELSLGGSYGDIARALFVTENTVKTHLTSIYRKLGVDRRADALQVARDLNLVAIPTIEPRT